MIKSIAKPMSVALAFSIFTQVTPIRGFVSSAYAQEAPKTSEVKQDKLQTIKQAIVNFNTNKDLGLPVNVAVDGFTKTIIDNEITVSDLTKFIDSLDSLTEQDKAEFKEIKEMAQLGAESNMDSEEFGQFAGRLLQTVDPQGLSWSGCAGLATGIVLLVASVVVGIVALTKTAGEERIRKRYQDKRNERANQYNNDVAWVNNRPAQIDKEINDRNGDIDYYQNKINESESKINYWRGVMDGTDDPAKKEEASDNIGRLLDDIDAYEIKINVARNDIDGLLIEKNQYNDPQFVYNKLHALEIDYNGDMAAYNSEEQKKIELVPANKKLAGKLGIGAGIGAAIGTYLVIDGRKGC